MATPVVHDGIPVAIRERKNSLKHSEEEDKQKKAVTGFLSFIVHIETVLTGSGHSGSCSVGEKSNKKYGYHLRE